MKLASQILSEHKGTFTELLAAFVEHMIDGSERLGPTHQAALDLQLRNFPANSNQERVVSANAIATWIMMVSLYNQR